IRLAVDQAANVSVSLQVGQVSNEVTVTGEAELVSSRTATGGQVVSQVPIVELPLNGRRPERLMYLAAGTVDLGRNSCRICGNGAGGIVNVVTRSGTNDIHGSLFEFLRNGKLNARQFFAVAQDQLKRNQFGGSGGGRIVKDKLFYFGTYQGSRVRNVPSGQVQFVPTQAQQHGDLSSCARRL